MKRVVRDVMTTRVVTAHPDAPFKEIARLMVKNRVSALPVVVSTDGIVGIVSEADRILKEDPDLAGGGHLFEGLRHRSKRRPSWPASS